MLGFAEIKSVKCQDIHITFGQVHVHTHLNKGILDTHIRINFLSYSNIKKMHCKEGQVALYRPYWVNLTTVFNSGRALFIRKGGVGQGAPTRQLCLIMKGYRKDKVTQDVYVYLASSACLIKH